MPESTPSSVASLARDTAALLAASTMVGPWMMASARRTENSGSQRNIQRSRKVPRLDPAPCSRPQGTAISDAFTAQKNAIASLAAQQAKDKTAIIALTDAIKELSAKANLANTAIGVLMNNISTLKAELTLCKADLLAAKTNISSLVDDGQALLLWS